MRLLTRKAIHAAYGIPLKSVDERMRELGVAPYLPRKKGRGWKVQYDADEIEIALANERERRLTACETRSASVRKRPADGIMGLSWKDARQRLTKNSPLQ